jgi:dipeptidyl aminopeptidase/acylaminoacyl peptidase
VHPNEEIQIATPERRATTVKGTLDPSKIVTSTPLLDAQSIIDYSPRRVAAESRRMLWICIENDAVVPATQSLQMFDLASAPKRLVILPGNSHYGAYVEHFARIREEIDQWFRTHLFDVSATTRES